jgi:hypothetical protein
LVRRFYERDGNRSEIGEKTSEEKELAVNFFDASSPEAKNEGYWDRKDLLDADEEYVLRVAGKWSVNPSSSIKKDFRWNLDYWEKSAQVTPLILKSRAGNKWDFFSDYLADRIKAVFRIGGGARCGRARCIVPLQGRNAAKI